MSGLISSLLSNTQALNTHLVQVETTGRNIANVNDANYARQRVITGDIGSINTSYGAVSMGTEVTALQQVRNIALDQQILKETMSLGALQAEADANSMLESYLTDSIGVDTGLDSLDTASAEDDSSGGLVNQIDNFFLAFEQLSAMPNTVSAKQEVYQDGEMLASQLQTMDQQLTEIDESLTATIESDLQSANTLLNEIADLNYQISRVEAGGKTEAYDLRSTRQQKLEDLASYIDFSVSTNAANDSMIDISVNVAAGGTLNVLNGTYTSANLNFDSTNNQVLYGTPGTVLDITGGSVAGNLSVKTSTIPEFRSTLDAIAEELVTSVNAAYNPSGLGDFFDATGITAATISLDSSLTSTNLRATEVAGGGNEIASAVANLRDTSFSTTSGDTIDGTFDDVVHAMNNQVGLNVVSSESKLESQSTVVDYLTTQRQNVNGVSLDEETADLIRFQRAYEASARVIRVVDEMLDTLVNSTG